MKSNREVTHSDIKVMHVFCEYRYAQFFQDFDLTHPKMSILRSQKRWKILAAWVLNDLCGLYG